MIHIMNIGGQAVEVHWAFICLVSVWLSFFWPHKITKLDIFLKKPEDGQ